MPFDGILKLRPILNADLDVWFKSKISYRKVWYIIKFLAEDGYTCLI